MAIVIARDDRLEILLHAADAMPERAGTLVDDAAVAGGC